MDRSVQFSGYKTLQEIGVRRDRSHWTTWKVTSGPRRRRRRRRKCPSEDPRFNVWGPWVKNNIKNVYLKKCSQVVQSRGGGSWELWESSKVSLLFFVQHPLLWHFFCIMYSFGTGEQCKVYKIRVLFLKTVGGGSKFDFLKLLYSKIQVSVDPFL